MTSNKPIVKSKSRRVSISKSKLAETADEIEAAATVAAVVGTREAIRGAERLEAAEELSAVGTVMFAKGARDLTKAEDVKLVADRMEVLGEAVAVAGVVDVAEGAEMLAASEDVGVLSALVGMMSEEDLEHGLELARLSGEMETVGEMVDSLKMPILAKFIYDRANRLHEMSVEQIRLAISTDGVSQVMAAAGEKITALGENEVKEGMARVAISEAVSEKTAAMEKASEDLAMQGLEEVIIAGEVAQAARAEAVEGAAEISRGSAVVGAAVAADEVASTLKRKSE